jgi:hypothetical protein
MVNTPIRKKIFLVLKILISFSLLTYLLLKIEWGKSLQTIQNANIYWLGIALVYAVVDIILLTYKWNLLLKIQKIIISFWRLFAINMIGGFWGLFLPSSLSGDVVRGYYLFKDSSDKAISVTSLIVDRLIALIALFIFVDIALLFSGNILKDFHLGYYIISFFVLLAIGLVVFNTEKFLNLLKKLDSRLENNKVVKKAIKLRKALIEYKKYPIVLSISFLIAMVIQLSRVLWYIVIANAFGIHIPLMYYFIFCPLLVVILMIPVSIGGIGVREGSFVALFTIAGMTLDEAVIVSFTSSLIVNITTIAGGVVHLFYRFENGLRNSLTSAQPEIK